MPVLNSATKLVIGTLHFPDFQEILRERAFMMKSEAAVMCH